MSATLTLIQTTFEKFFTETETCVNFTIESGATGTRLSFVRNDIRLPIDPYEGPIPKGFITFAEALESFSKWGYSKTEFILMDGDEIKFEYHITPDDLWLPNILNHMAPNDVLVRDEHFLFRKKAIKHLIKDMEKSIIKFIKSELAKIV